MAERTDEHEQVTLLHPSSHVDETIQDSIHTVESKQTLLCSRIQFWLLVVVRLLAVAAVITLIVLGIIYREQVTKYLSIFLQRVKDWGIYGMLLYVLLYAVATVLFLPGTILSIAAGFIYGFLIAFPIISIGSTLGATCAFILGKTLVRTLIAHKIRQYPKFEAIDRAIAHEGWKVVLLLRLNPVIPFTLINYCLALTRIHILAYIFFSWIGMIPGTCLYVYLGSSSRDLADILSGNVGPNLPLKIALLCVGGVVIVIFFIVMLVIGKRAWNRIAEEQEVRAIASDPS